MALASTVDETLSAVDEHRPDFVMIDLDGQTPSVLVQVRERGSDIPMVVFSANDDPINVTRVLEAGAAAYVLKDTTPDLLDHAIRQVLTGRRFIDPEVAVALFDAGDVLLTSRERDVLLLASRGLPNKSIAFELHIGTETVRTHMASVIAKLDAGNRTGAVAKALRMTLIV